WHAPAARAASACRPGRRGHGACRYRRRRCGPGRASARTPRSPEGPACRGPRGSSTSRSSWLPFRRARGGRATGLRRRALRYLGWQPSDTTLIFFAESGVPIVGLPVVSSGILIFPETTSALILASAACADAGTSDERP